MTFDANDGSAVDPATVSYGGTVTQPAAPTRDGYTFTGWYTDEACTQAYDFSDTVTGDLTLYAGWEETGGCGSAIVAAPFAAVGGIILCAAVLLILKKKKGSR